MVLYSGSVKEYTEQAIRRQIANGTFAEFLLYNVLGSEVLTVSALKLRRLTGKDQKSIDIAFRDSMERELKEMINESLELFEEDPVVTQHNLINEARESAEKQFKNFMNELLQSKSS